MFQKIMNFFHCLNKKQYCDNRDHRVSESAESTDLNLTESDKEVLKHLDDKIVVGKVKSLTAHKDPKVTRVKVAQVNLGNGKTEQILCGGVNLEDQDIVVVAMVGAKLSEDFEIGERNIRGEDSRGMICARKELNLSLAGEPDHGIWKLPAQLESKLGTKIKVL